MSSTGTPEVFDYLAIGSGEGGKFVAFNLSSKLGKKCVVIERKWFGGSCPNIACLPSKNFLHSAEVAHYARINDQFGLPAAKTSSGKPAVVDMMAIKHRKVEMVDGAGGTVDLHRDLFKSSGVPVCMGEARFVGEKLVQVGDRLITAENIVINTGSRAFIDPTIPGLVASQPLTHIEALNLETLPSHLIIIGGGYVGVEFAQAFARFGSRVTVIQRQSQIMPKEDKDIIDTLKSILEGEGVNFLTSTTIESVKGVSGQSVTLTINTAGNRTTIEGSHVLVAAGRLPNNENIGLELAGVKTTPSGHIVVDEQLRTTAPGIYAVGDCAGSPYFTHMGFDDFRVVFQDIIGSPRPNGTLDRQVPSTLFTSPELARVGLSEKEAQERGIKYRKATLPMGVFLRTRTFGPEETRGFAKALIETDGDKILGFAALGPHAGEMLPVVQLVMQLGLSYETIENMILVHPTMNEGLVALFSGVPPRTT